MPLPKITPAEIEQHLATLAATPRRLQRFAASQTAATLRQAPGPKDWSAVEILAHLRGCDDVWSVTIYAMLAADNPQLSLPHPRRWAQVAHYAKQDFAPSLKLFTLKRAEFVKRLQKLSLADWGRTAILDRRLHSVFSQVRRLALHEAIHCEQLERRR